MGDEEERKVEWKRRDREDGRKGTRAQGGGETLDDDSDRSSGTRESQTVGVERRKQVEKKGIRDNDAGIPDWDIELYT